jgi:hypothetical protein
MAWQEVETDVGSKVGRVKYSVALKHGGARVSVPKAIGDQLGWKKTTLFRLLVGGGDSTGKLKIEPVEKGRIVSKAPPRAEGFIIRLGRWEGLAPRDVKGLAVDHEIAGNALVVSLPRHALAVPPGASPPASAPTRPVFGGGGKVDVTDKVAGRNGNGGRPMSRPPGA